MKKVSMLMISLLFAGLPVMAQESEKIEKRHPRPKMSLEVRTAFKACAKETGVKRPDFSKGERPTKEDRAKMKACLKEKGIEMPRNKKHDKKIKESAE